MTERVKQSVIGARGMWEPSLSRSPLKTFHIPVIIDDARDAYGNAQYLIRPEHGAGLAWVNADRVRLDRVP